MRKEESGQPEQFVQERHKTKQAIEAQERLAGKLFDVDQFPDELKPAIILINKGVKSIDDILTQKIEIPVKKKCEEAEIYFLRGIKGLSNKISEFSLAGAMESVCTKVAEFFAIIPESKPFQKLGHAAREGLKKVGIFVLKSLAEHLGHQRGLSREF